ncbi:YncE family protein [Poseidonocella sedimentorum]|uniref:40-residue YVTN family beta-propeller repeat-containing protein n=1 Tax=Poseidonocella sedimentorum TaxID=871652 RepID=A0A1I6E3X1_9RHOB|nr:hypothetical protein [Poseidonocella sedimentorum]SFR12460.1 hypothetical protein SAMN04515673_10766 [Poseidonocella sedimentorum]
MITTTRLGRALCATTALLCWLTPAAAQTAFDTPAEFSGRIGFSTADRAPIYPGSTVQITGAGFAPGQTVTIERGDAALVPALTADAEGNVSAEFTLDEDAALGLHPVVVKTDGPDSASVVQIKVSPDIAFSGADQFEISKVSLGGGLYQVAISEKNNTLFVTSAVGRPPVSDSRLIKLDAESLEVLAEAAPADAPDRGDRDGGVFAVYGVGVDDVNNTVWATNTRQNTVAVYSQDDLSLIKQFEPGTASHPRDAIVDATRGRVYVSIADAGINVYDAEALELVETIVVPSGIRRETFSTMSIALDEARGQLYTVSRTTPEAARIDLASGEVTILPLNGVDRASGVDVSEDGTKLFVVSQGSDDLKVISAEDGSEMLDVAVGAQALNVVYVESQKLAYVANRASDSLAVVSDSGEIVANLPGGPFPNFVEESDAGVVYLINKARGEAPDGNTLWRIVRK